MGERQCNKINFCPLLLSICPFARATEGQIAPETIKLPQTLLTDQKRFKVAEHSFQVPIPNSPLFLNYLRFGARFLQESRLTTEEFIPAFWLRCVLLPWQPGWFKNKA